MSKERLIGVVGAGTMGAGIAHALAWNDHRVVCADADPDIVRKAFDAIRKRMDDRVQRGRCSAFARDQMMGRMRVADSLDQLSDAEIVIEAVMEDTAVKRTLFGRLEGICGDQTILATNTSSLSITKLAEALNRPDRFIGMHFFNPAPVMPLVEVIPGERTGRRALVEAVALANALEKTPVQAKDRPGFIANRVARPFYLESLDLLQRGIADVATIDGALRAGGFPMGPFELLDLIGLDVNLAVTHTVHQGFDRADRFAPNPVQEKLVAQNKLGRKTGRGFYSHGAETASVAFETQVNGPSKGVLKAPAFVAFAAALNRPADLETWIYARVVSAVINEGAVTAGDQTAKPRDVDLAMTLGLRYPEGPMTLADHVGLDVVLDLLQTFEADSPSGRHAPAPLLVERVRDGELGEKTASGFLWHSL
ncbi:MAG: 3-hydroxyacyl-CoA dehydrogenase NAD-binding domain-containing protein [Phycisphaerae bacterium]